MDELLNCINNDGLFYSCFFLDSVKQGNIRKNVKESKKLGAGGGMRLKRWLSSEWATRQDCVCGNKYELLCKVL